MYLVTYFKYLYFNHLTTLQTNTLNNLGFSRALPAAHALQSNTQNNCAWPGSQISVICGKPRTPLSPTRGSSPDPAGGLPSPRLPVLPQPPNPGYVTE